MIAPFGPTLEMVGKLSPTKSFCWLKNSPNRNEQNTETEMEERRGGGESERGTEKRVVRGYDQRVAL